MRDSNNMKASSSIYLTLTVLLFSQVSCDWNPAKPDLPRDVRILNHWIWDGLNDIYLWESTIPNLDPDYQEDPKTYFYDLLYTDDKYSWIVEDYEELAALFDGVELSTGMSARPLILQDSTVIGVIEFVTPASPAEDEGIKRGDIIIAIDGQTLTKQNYYSLFYQNTASFEFGVWNGTDVLPTGEKVTLTAAELNQNPVIHSEVIDYQGMKTGYLVYTQFTNGKSDEWYDELNGVFEDFKNEGVTNVVLDLRYNPGGSLDLSAYIASTLCPKSAMENEEVYLNLVWNEYYNQFWKEYDWDEDGQADGENSVQLVVNLPKSELNLDLSRVYFLTTDNTASASESLITGLYPYMNVVQIGTTTYGKCYASVTIDDWADPKRHTWAMQPIVLKYSNADGFTDFVNGIDPDFEVPDNLLEAEPFGSLQDPLLAKALEEITGVSPSLKSAGIPEKRFKAMPVQKNRMVERRISLPGIFSESLY